MTQATAPTPPSRPLTPAASRILDAAGRLFYERGITEVGVELLAAEAGTTKKTLYDRFGSKDGLIVAYLEARMRRWQDHVSSTLAASSATGAERVLVVLDALEQWLAGGERGCGFINAYAELSGRSAAATAVVRAEKEWIRSCYQQVLVEAGLGRGADRDRALAGQLALVHEGAIVARTAGASERAMADARTVVETLLSVIAG